MKKQSKKFSTLKEYLKHKFDFIKRVFQKWSDDNSFNMAASLSYYTIFSLAPILLIVISVAGYFFGREAISGQIYTQINDLVGEQGAVAVQNMVEAAYQQSGSSTGIFAKTIGILTLIVSATATFGVLQTSLNTIWEVKAKPTNGIMGFLTTRVLSFAVVLSIAFLLMVSLVINAVLVALGDYIAGQLPGISEALIHIAQLVVSFGVITLLFAVIFKFLPDVQLKWGEVWRGAIVTAVLFTIGKTLIGLYLGQSNVTSGYGAAASVILIILWVNYSSLIFFLGAEYIYMYVKDKGEVIEPSKHAVKVVKKEVEYDAEGNPLEERRHGTQKRKDQEEKPRGRA